VILSALPCKEARMNVRYAVSLTEAERSELQATVAGGSRLARRVKKAQVLLAADSGASDEEIARLVRVGTSTVYRTKKRLVEEGVEAALSDRPRPGAERKLSAKEEALLMATACTKPPLGRARWTLKLLAGELVRLTDHASVSTETVRRHMHEKDIKPWQRKMWCISAVDGEYVARMEDVLELYDEEPDPSFPVICFDESPTQLIGETRVPIAAKPGARERYDYEYRRNGTANLFVFLDAHRPWRHVKVTDQRTAIDFAECMRELVDVHYPNCFRIRVVLDNLSTHNKGNLYEAFPAAEAQRIANKLEFHYTPKHGSWLNMVEIEIGTLRTMCLDRRIADRPTLNREVAAWVRQRNASKARVRWLFDVAQARHKMARAYPKPAASTTRAAA
jgi:transposase